MSLVQQVPLLLAGVNDDAATFNSLVETVIINVSFVPDIIFFPNPDPEGIAVVGVVIFGPQHELVVTLTVDGARPFELGIGTGLIDYQPLVAGAVEVQIRRLEYELCVTGGGISP